MDVIEILENNAVLYPQKRAYGFLDKEGALSEDYTYAELRDHVRAAARQFGQRYTPGARVIILLPTEGAFIKSFLGSLYAGLVAVPCPIGFSEPGINRILNIIRDCDASAIVTNRKTFKMLFQRQTDASKVLQEYPIDWFYTEDLDNSRDISAPPARVADDNTTAYLQYTSGSTSFPKGVMVSHKNLTSNLSAINNCFGRTSEDTSVTWLPHYHDMGLVDGLLSPLYTGGSGIVLSPLLFVTKPLLFLQAITRFGAAVCGGPGFGLDHCVARITAEQLQALDLSTLRVLYVGAEPIRISTLEKFAETMKVTGFRREALVPSYGLAEATLAVSLHFHDTPLIYKKISDEQSKEVVACGPPVEFTEVVIADPVTKNALGSDAIGEIWVKNNGVALGYWNNPEATSATFHCYTSAGAGPYLKTGDLGFLSEGKVFITGRTKELIIIRGVNYYPQDIEEVVSESHEIIQPNATAAFSIDTELGEALMIVTETRRSAQGNESMDDVVAEIAQRIGLAFGLVPHKILLIQTGKLPKTSSGKIQRLKAKEIFAANV